MSVLRARLADQPIRFRVPAFWRWPGKKAAVESEAKPTSREPVVLVIRVPHLNLPGPKLLDLYLAREYLRVFFLGLGSFLALFYISTFIDMADKLFKGQATTSLLLRYFYYQTPQFVYYVIPMGVLVASLVTIGLMSKNSELIVMRACGISLYRAVAPLVGFALVASI